MDEAVARLKIQGSCPESPATSSGTSSPPICCRGLLWVLRWSRQDVGLCRLEGSGAADRQQPIAGLLQDSGKEVMKSDHYV